MTHIVDDVDESPEWVNALYFDALNFVALLPSADVSHAPKGLYGTEQYRRAFDGLWLLNEARKPFAGVREIEWLKTRLPNGREGDWLIKQLAKIEDKLKHSESRDSKKSR